MINILFVNKNVELRHVHEHVPSPVLALSCHIHEHVPSPVLALSCHIHVHVSSPVLALQVLLLHQCFHTTFDHLDIGVEP